MQRLESLKTPSAGIDAVYSLHLSKFRRATAYRDGEYLRFLTVAPYDDATHGKT